MAQFFSEANRVLRPAGQLTVVYAHKTTFGWTTLVAAMKVDGCPNVAVEYDRLELLQFLSRDFVPMNAMCERAEMFDAEPPP